MGLMDNIKNAQEMAKQAQEMAAQQQQPGAMPGMPDAEDQQLAQLSQKLWNSGLKGTATIKALNETGKVDAGGKQYAVDATVELEGESPYDITVKQYMAGETLDWYAPGKKAEIRVDPDDKSKGLLYGSAE